MSTFYDLLGLAPTATAPEIEQALDREYAKWLQLVTHHKPDVVSEANSNLRLIEQARSVLLDPAGRANYDAQLAVGSVGGVSDPTASGGGGLGAGPFGGQPFMAPPNISRPTVPASVAPQPAAPPPPWICPACNTANRPQAKFCSKCGQSLSRYCPKCGQANELTVEFCSSCGTNIQQYVNEKEMELQRVREQERRQQSEQAMLKPIMDAANTAWWAAIGGAAAALFLGFCTAGLGSIAGVAVAGFGAWKGFQVSQMSQIPGDAPHRSRARQALYIGGAVVVLAAIGLVLFILSAIFGAIGNALR